MPKTKSKKNPRFMRIDMKKAKRVDLGDADGVFDLQLKLFVKEIAGKVTVAVAIPKEDAVMLAGKMLAATVPAKGSGKPQEP